MQIARSTGPAADERLQPALINHPLILPCPRKQLFMPIGLPLSGSLRRKPSHLSRSSPFLFPPPRPPPNFLLISPPEELFKPRTTLLPPCCSAPPCPPLALPLSLFTVQMGCSCIFKPQQQQQRRRRRGALVLLCESPCLFASLVYLNEHKGREKQKSGGCTTLDTLSTGGGQFFGRVGPESVLRVKREVGAGPDGWRVLVNLHIGRENSST